MARVRGTLNRYKESDYIFVTVERFGEKIKKRKVKRSSILTTTLNPRRLFLFSFFFFVSSPVCLFLTV